MKNIFCVAYALFLSAAILLVLWLLFPVAISSPVIAAIVLLILCLTSLGAGLRSLVETVLLTPIAKLVNGDASQLVASIVFGLAMLAALVIPWLGGIEGWKVWHWITAITYTVFSFETFYAFLLGVTRITKKEEE